MAVFTAIGAAIFGAGTFGALATAAALQVATGIAVSLIGKSLAGEDKPSKQRGTRLSMASGGNLPRSIMLGYGATAGSLVYANYWGNSGETPNAYFTQVICLTDYPVASLEQVWVNGELCTLADTPHASRGYPVLQYRKGGKDYLWIKFKDGTQTAADSFLTGTVASTDRPYQSTRVGKGCAYVIATSLVNDKLFSGYPSLLFALNGAKLYDISKDSTSGGSGAQRWNNPATWGGDGDHLPLVQAYNILRGITYNGNWFYGLQGLPVARLPNAIWVEQINKCRADTDGPDGTEADYRSGGEVVVSDSFAKAIEQMLTACQGRIAEIGGIYKPHVGAPSEASVFDFTDDHIISTQAQSFSPFFGLADTVNGIAATYPSPAEGWTPKAAKKKFNATYEAEDGNRRLMADVDLDMVPYKGQVQRLMKAALAEARRARRHTFVLPPEANILEPNDIITWTSERNGYEDKLFRVDGVYDRADLDVMVDITEVDPSDYDWDQDTDYTEPVDGPVVRVTPAPQVMTGWSAVPAQFEDEDGNTWHPSIEVGWAGLLDDVKSVRIQAREAWGASRLIFDGTIEYDIADPDPSAVLNAAFRAASDYEARGIFVPISDRDTEWSGWLGVTTPDVPEVPPIEVSMLGEELHNAYGIVTSNDPAAIPSVIAVLQQRAEELALAVMDLNATYRETLKVLAAQRDGANAAVIQNQLAIVSESEARAEQIDEVVAQFGDSLADGFLKFEAVANASESTARITAKVKATLGATFSQAAWMLKARATSGGGTIAQFGVLGNFYIYKDELDTGTRVFSVDSGGLVHAKALIVDETIVSTKKSGSTPYFQLNGLNGFFSFGIA